MSVVGVVISQVEVSATSWSLVQRSPTDCDVSLCVIKKPQIFELVEYTGAGKSLAGPTSRCILFDG